MKFEKLEDFYQVYHDQRTYVTAKIRKKHIRIFDEQFWRPAFASSNHSVLELGSGTGLFLAYLEAKGIDKFKGIDSDSNVLDYMPKSISEKMIIGDFWQTVEKLEDTFDRIVMFDVFEHFSFFEGHKLLGILKKRLSDEGKIVLRIPNASSPFGLQYQYGDLTHKAVYGPGSITHLALAAGYDVEACLSVKRGNRIKRFVEKILLGLVSRLLTEPPPLWGANMIVILAPKIK